MFNSYLGTYDPVSIVFTLFENSINQISYLRPCHQEFPVGVGRQRGPRVDVDDLGDGAGHGVAAAAQPRVLLRLDVRHRRRLRHSEALSEPERDNVFQIITSPILVGFSWDPESRLEWAGIAI